MLENVKAKPDAVLTRNEIDVIKGSDRCPGGLANKTWSTQGSELSGGRSPKRERKA